MIADINWVVFYSLLAFGATLTAVFTYFVATWSRSTGRPETTSGGHGTPAREHARTVAADQRRAA